MLNEILAPSFKVTSVTQINLSSLKMLGVEGILLDFDNTLVKWNESSLSRAIIRWVKAAKAAGFKLCIVSNAITRRLEEVALRLGIPFVPQALKPSTLGIRKALKSLDLEAEKTVMVGDQLFTDVLAGKCCGLHTVLVCPEELKEQWWMKGVRCLERFVVNQFEVEAA